VGLGSNITRNRLTCLDMFTLCEQSLASKLKVLDDTYERNAQQLSSSSIDDLSSSSSSAHPALTSATLQHRLLSYARDSSRMAQAEVERQVQTIRTSELSALRLEERAKYRAELESITQKLDKNYAEKVKQLEAREREMQDRWATKQRELETRSYEMRQKLLEGMNAAEREARVYRQAECCDVSCCSELERVRTRELDLKRNADLESKSVPTPHTSLVSGPLSFWSSSFSFFSSSPLHTADKWMWS
jgi:hypothetical protein